MAGEPIQRSLAAHLRYSFRFRPGSRPDCIYGGVYQGIGVSYYSFGNRGELGNPVAVYLFRARASHASARWYRSTTSGISACRSDGNPTTRTTTAPTS